MKEFLLRKDVLDAWKELSVKTDADIARDIKVTRMSMSRWMNGKRPIPLGAVIALESLTGIPMKQLITERNVEPPLSSSNRTAEDLLRRARLDVTATEAAS